MKDSLTMHNTFMAKSWYRSSMLMKWTLGLQITKPVNTRLISVFDLLFKSLCLSTCGLCPTFGLLEFTFGSLYSKFFVIFPLSFSCIQSIFSHNLSIFFLKNFPIYWTERQWDSRHYPFATRPKVHQIQIHRLPFSLFLLLSEEIGFFSIWRQDASSSREN